MTDFSKLPPEARRVGWIRRGINLQLDEQAGRHEYALRRVTLAEHRAGQAAPWPRVSRDAALAALDRAQADAAEVTERAEGLLRERGAIWLAEAEARVAEATERREAAERALAEAEADRQRAEADRAWLTARAVEGR